MVVEQKSVDHIPCDSRLPLWQVEGGSGSDQGEPVNADDFYHNLPMCICPNGQLIPGCFGEYGEVPPEAGDALQDRASFFTSNDASMDAVADNDDDDKKRQTYHNCGEFATCKGEKPQVVNEPKERIIYVYVDDDGRTREVPEREGGGGAGEAAESGSVGGGGDRAGAEGAEAGEAAGSGPGDAADRAGAKD